jgi:hypothetical protein|tara:strand:- start:377 stop:619 length:243 start_codon:yes stop_codon:yes gene_type:complete
MSSAIKNHIDSLPERREDFPDNKIAEKNMKSAWRLWAKAIGEKEGTTDREADKIAIIRSIIVLVNFITCFVIVAGNIHNW